MRKRFKKKMLQILKIIKQNKVAVLLLIAFGIAADIFFIEGSSDVRLFGILALYIFSVWLFKLKSRQTFLICLLLLGVMFILFLTTGTSDQTEKAAVWLVLFMPVGIVQQWRE